jgi:catechol 2,3-dioxygenase-like lactoylglutathione lyase family enzyme
MPRHIDHLVLAVRDLDAAAALYEALGFTLTPRALHPWGTANRLVQLQGGFLELLAVAEPDKLAQADRGGFGFGTYNAAFLEKREGMSMLVLASADAEADRAAFAAAGIDPRPLFHFGRDAKLPDGRLARVAFTLAFVTPPAMPEAAFFVCQQHAPELFWKPEYQRHANGARRIAGLTMQAADPAATARFLEKLLDSRAGAHGDGLVIATDDAPLRLCPGAVPSPRFAAFDIAVGDPGAVAARLSAAGIAHRIDGAALVVPAFGANLRFVDAAFG